MAEFKTIHTTYGLVSMMQAEASSLPINLTHMAVGDGGGLPITPDEAMTDLVNERWRTTINTVTQDPSSPSTYYVEMVIPAAVGGWTVREVGVFDDDGNLFAVSNYPDTYKTLPSDGATNDLVIRLEIIVSNAAVITVMVDPSVAVATRSWVLNNVSSASLIPGGTTGQVLTKQSNGDGDADWQDPGSSTVLVNTLEEHQTLAAGQLTVNMTARTTFGLSVLVEGVRLPRRAGFGGWQQGVDETQIVLGGPEGGGYYPAGSEVTMLQNEPAGNLPTPLERSLNLSDVADKAAARTNLDIFSKAETRQMAPASQVAYFARNSAPTGWLKANGAAVSRTVYSDLFAAIGTTFGSGDGVNTFTLPDLRGEFIRTWDDGRGVDTGRAFGSAQGDAIRNITGWFTGVDDVQTNGAFYKGININTSASSPGGNVSPLVGFDASRTVPTAGENRPRSVALLACIKY